MSPRPAAVMHGARRASALRRIVTFMGDSTRRGKNEMEEEKQQQESRRSKRSRRSRRSRRGRAGKFKTWRR